MSKDWRVKAILHACKLELAWCTPRLHNRHLEAPCTSRAQESPFQILKEGLGTSRLQYVSAFSQFSALKTITRHCLRTTKSAEQRKDATQYA